MSCTLPCLSVCFRPNAILFRYFLVICLTISFFIIELIVGYLANSLALVADSFHMLSDFIGLFVALISHCISRWPASNKNTFGWQRAEIVGTTVNTVILLTLSFTIAINALQRFIKLECVLNPKLIVFVGITGLIINVIGLLILLPVGGGHGHSHGGHGHSHDSKKPQKDNSNEIKMLINKTESDQFPINHENLDSKPKHDHSSTSNFINSDQEPTNNHHQHDDCAEVNLDLANLDDVITSDDNSNSSLGVVVIKPSKLSHSNMGMKAAFLHVAADAMGSVIVVIVASILWYNIGGESMTEERCFEKTPKVLLYLDPALSLVLVGLIFATAFPLAKKSILILLQSVPNEIDFRELQEKLRNLDGVNQVHDLHVWRLKGNAIIATVHVQCLNISDYDSVSRRMKQIFHNYGIHCTTIQPEFNNIGTSNTKGCLIKCGSNEDCGDMKICCPSGDNTLKQSNNLVVSTESEYLNSN